MLFARTLCCLRCRCLGSASCVLDRDIELDLAVRWRADFEMGARTLDSLTYAIFKVVNGSRPLSHSLYEHRSSDETYIGVYIHRKISILT